MKQIGRTFLFLSVLVGSIVLLPKVGLSYNALSFTALTVDPYTEGTLTGVVKDEAGAPVAGVTVTAQRTGDKTLMDDNPTAKTDADGKYEIVLDIGTYTIDFVKDGYASVEKTGVKISSGAATVQDVTLVLNKTTGTLAGVVKDEDGKPVAGVTVTAYLTGSKIVTSGEPTTVTDVDGKYTLDLDAGTYTIKFVKDGYDFKDMEGVVISAGEETTEDVVLTPFRIYLPIIQK